MDTELLKTFLEVEKTRHFGRAAENLYLTPAAVSARIRQLEGIIGMPLLIRNRKHIALTPAGEQLKPRAQEVLAALSRAIADPLATPKGVQQFSLGATPNLWDFFLSPLLARLTRLTPPLSLKAECHDSGFLISQLQSRQADVVFLLDPIELDGVKCDVVASVEMKMFATEPGIVTSTLGDLGYVQIDWSIGFGVEHQRVASSGLSPVLHASTGKIALDHLSLCGGAGYFPGWCGEAGQRTTTLYPVADQPGLQLDLYMLYLDGTRKATVIDSIRATFQAGLPLTA